LEFDLKNFFKPKGKEKRETPKKEKGTPSK